MARSSISRDPGTFEARASRASGSRTCNSWGPAQPAMYRRPAGEVAIHLTGNSGRALVSDATPGWNTTEMPSTVRGKYAARYSRVCSSEYRTRSASSAWVDSCRAVNDGDADSTHATDVYARDPLRGSGEHRNAIGGDRRDLLGGALELLVGQHRGALERELPGQLEPRPAPAVFIAHLDGHRPRDPIGPQQDHVERMTALPGQPLLGVVGRPYIERRQCVDRAPVGDRVV